MGKRKREMGPSAHAVAYQNVRYHLIPPTNQPGSPSRYFQASYRVEFQDQGRQTTRERQDRELPDQLPFQQMTRAQVVHVHGNGLVVVTAGNCLEGIHETALSNLAFQNITELAAASVGAKRAHLAKLLAGKSSEDAVIPRSALATCSGLILRSCVFGLVLELNSVQLRENPDIILHDPLLNGYLAVVLPAGAFPPASSV